MPRLVRIRPRNTRAREDDDGAPPPSPPPPPARALVVDTRNQARGDPTTARALDPARLARGTRAHSPRTHARGAMTPKPTRFFSLAGVMMRRVKYKKILENRFRQSVTRESRSIEPATVRGKI